MYKSDFLKNVARFKRGQFIRVHYKTDLTDDMKASMKLLYRVSKETTNTFKYGVDLRNVKRYQEREAARTEPKKVVTAWAKWVDGHERVLKENLKTGRLYASFITLPKNSNAHTKYFITTLETGEVTEVTKEELKMSGLMRDSYFNKSSSETVLIPLENIVEIY